MSDTVWHYIQSTQNLQLSSNIDTLLHSGRWMNGGISSNITKAERKKKNIFKNTSKWEIFYERNKRIVFLCLTLRITTKRLQHTYTHTQYTLIGTRIIRIYTIVECTFNVKYVDYIRAFWTRYSRFSRIQSQWNRAYLRGSVRIEAPPKPFFNSHAPRLFVHRTMYFVYMHMHNGNNSNVGWTRSWNIYQKTVRPYAFSLSIFFLFNFILRKTRNEWIIKFYCVLKREYLVCAGYLSVIRRALYSTANKTCRKKYKYFIHCWAAPWFRFVYPWICF